MYQGTVKYIICIDISKTIAIHKDNPLARTECTAHWVYMEVAFWHRFTDPAVAGHKSPLQPSPAFRSSRDPSSLSLHDTRTLWIMFRLEYLYSPISLLKYCSSLRHSLNALSSHFQSNANSILTLLIHKHTHCWHRADHMLAVMNNHSSQLLTTNIQSHINTHPTFIFISYSSHIHTFINIQTLLHCY